MIIAEIHQEKIHFLSGKKPHATDWLSGKKPHLVKIYIQLNFLLSTTHVWCQIDGAAVSKMCKKNMR